MGDERKPIGKDASGHDVLTTAVKALLNQFPGLYEYEAVKFEELEKDYGIAFSADNGALIFSETEDVIGGVHQTASILSILYTVHHPQKSARNEHTGIS